MPGSLVDIIGGIGELIQWLRASIAGWKYLLSKEYRRKTHVKWQSYSKLKIIWQIICGIVGLLFSFLVLYGAFVLFKVVLEGI
jgi:hypothetical protein